MSESERAAALLRKQAEEYQHIADHGFAYDTVYKDGSHSNPNAERARQSAIKLRDAADLIERDGRRIAELEEALRTAEECIEGHFEDDCSDCRNAISVCRAALSETAREE